jgi:hypothetical protein
MPDSVWPLAVFFNDAGWHRMHAMRRDRCTFPYGQPVSHDGYTWRFINRVLSRETSTIWWDYHEGVSDQFYASNAMQASR